MSMTDDLKQRAEEVLGSYQDGRYVQRSSLAECLRAYMQRCEELEDELKRCQEMYMRDA